MRVNSHIIKYFSQFITLQIDNYIEYSIVHSQILYFLLNFDYYFDYDFFILPLFSALKMPLIIKEQH